MTETAKPEEGLDALLLSNDRDDVYCFIIKLSERAGLDMGPDAFKAVETAVEQEFDPDQHTHERVTERVFEALDRYEAHPLMESFEEVAAERAGEPVHHIRSLLIFLDHCEERSIDLTPPDPN